MSTAKTTVLVLHGYSQNASIFSKRLGALRKQCGKNVDFVFVDGPHILQPVDLVGMASPSASAEATLSALGASEAGVEKNEARAWWKWNEHKSEPLGLPESLETIRDVLKTRTFQGVFGFSQGATFAALLCALLERPHVYPPFLVDGKAPHPPFKFCVSVSGFRLTGTIPDAIYEAPFLTPTLHIIGRNDVIIIEERSHRLVAISANARVEEHDGGHFVPSKGSWRKFLAAYLEDPSDDIPSPSLAMSSANNSGTATPMESETPQMKL